MVLLRCQPIKDSPFGWFPYPLEPLVYIKLSRPLPLFSLLQEPSTITEVIEEIFEVNTNKDIDDIDLCDFTQDTSPILTTPLLYGRSSQSSRITPRSLQQPLSLTLPLPTQAPPPPPITALPPLPPPPSPMTIP